MQFSTLISSIIAITIAGYTSPASASPMAEQQALTPWQPDNLLHMTVYPSSSGSSFTMPVPAAGETIQIGEFPFASLEGI
jgi:hypothetical protein